MPWSHADYYRAVCDGCGVPTQSADLSTRKALYATGAYCPRGSGSQEIYCPECIMTKNKAYGGQAAHGMTPKKASQLQREHWYTAAEALELGYVNQVCADTAGLQQSAGAEPPEPPRRAARNPW